MNEENVMESLKKRVKELEDKVEALRISRRVLMNLIDTLEREKREQIVNLEVKNEKLQKNNCRYARSIMHRNIQILELEERLKHAGFQEK